MIFRFADHHDLENLIDLRLDFFKESFANRPALEPIVDNIRYYLKEHLGKDCLAIIAQDGDLVAATAFLLVFHRPPNPTMPNGRVGEICNVMTRPAYRRQGLALEMTRKLIDEGRRLGLTRLDLAASPAGRKVYEKLGFLEPEDHTYMYLPLT